MKTVWAVSSGEYDCYMLHRIFAHRKNAKAYADEINAHLTHYLGLLADPLFLEKIPFSEESAALPASRYAAGCCCRNCSRQDKVIGKPQQPNRQLTGSAFSTGSRGA